MQMSVGSVAVIGVGTIGRGWATLFAKAGFEVALFDSAADSLARAKEAIKVTLDDLSVYGLVDDPAAVLARIRIAGSMAEAVAGAAFVQESVPEELATKQSVLKTLDALAGPEAIVSSSCSSLLPADIFQTVARPHRCIVAHPFNPPHLMPLVELLPGPETSEETLEVAYGLMTLLGQSPVILRKAVPGYVANRLQAAVVNEAMHLVAQGVISPSDLDLCMTESLGRRWAFLGPFETMDLNADAGVEGYAERFREAYHEVGEDLDCAGRWPDAAIEAVVSSRRAAVPIEDLQARQEWRDRRLMEMLAMPLRRKDPPAPR
jgi:L-gulonate 3-dehydrogenase